MPLGSAEDEDLRDLSCEQWPHTAHKFITVFTGNEKDI